MEQQDPGYRRDWSHLTPDLVALILTMLEVPDLLAVATVCRAWRAAYKADPRLDAAPFFRAPCLVFHAGDDPGSQTATLRSLADGGGGRRVQYSVSVPDPPFPTRYVMGSSHGWLATADESSDLLLINPVTRAEVRLPPIGSLRNVTCRVKRGILRSYRVHHIDPGGSVRRRHVRKKPFESLKPDQGRLYFYLKSSCKNYQDFFYNGEDELLYAIRTNYEVHTIDLHGPFPMVVKVIFNANPTVSTLEAHKYIVRAPWTDILQVSLYDDEDDDVKLSKIIVYKMDFTEQNIVEVKDLRGYALFIGFNNSFFFLPTDDSAMIKQNRVYRACDLVDYDYTHNMHVPRRVKRGDQLELALDSISLIGEISWDCSKFEYKMRTTDRKFDESISEHDRPHVQPFSPNYKFNTWNKFDINMDRPIGIRRLWLSTETTL
ncbi:hypothetical protein EJB05_26646, partial [Eragrostis curvula]